ncbi:MAG: hypothetical protein Q9227_005886 [Pyrenula ochraceoflavens]
MYMALFNGGRWIREQLRNAGAEFWLDGKSRFTPEGEGEPRDIGCLNFWEFDSETDGEELKEEFKRRIDTVAEMLTTEERQDVVTEAVKIFEICSELVDKLDQAIGREMILSTSSISSFWLKAGIAWQWAISLRSTLTQRLQWPEWCPIRKEVGTVQS